MRTVGRPDKNLLEIKSICLSHGFEILDSEWNGYNLRYNFKCLKHGESHNRTWRLLSRFWSLPCCRKEKTSGKNSVRWIHTLTDEQRKSNKVFRRTMEYRNWSRTIKRRYKFKCLACGVSENLHSHHLESYASNRELGLDRDNGVCICKGCHKKFHNEYGQIDNTKLQFEEFLRKSYGIHFEQVCYNKENN